MPPLVPPSPSPYRQVLAAPGARPLLAASAAGRTGVAMAGLGLVWLVHGATGSFAQAGLVTGAFAVAEATGGPLVARLVDARGQTRVVPLVLLVHTAAVGLLLGAVVSGAPLPVLVACGVLAGVSLPQVGAYATARWPSLLARARRGELVGTAFAVESMTNGVAYLLGPALVGTLAGVVHPVAGTATSTALVLVGGVALAAQRRSAPVAGRTAGGPGTDGGHGPPARPLLQPALVVLVAVSLGVGVFFGSMQVSVTAVAVTAGAQALAGPLYSLMAASSLVSTLGYGRRRWRPAPQAQLRWALGLLVLACAPLLVVASPGGLVLPLLLQGLAMAPALVLLPVLTQAVVPARVLTQALAWGGAATAAGAALGAAGAGQLVDGLGPRWGFALAAAAVVAAAACAASRALAPPPVAARTGGGGRGALVASVDG